MLPEIDQEKPRQSVFHNILGSKKIEEICKSYSLDEAGKKIVDKILQEYQELPGGNTVERFAIMMNKIDDFPKPGNVLFAVFQIHRELAKKIKRIQNYTPHLSESASKAQNN